MHEISLVRNIFKTLEEEFPEDFRKVKKIFLKAGILSNVQPILMQNALEAVQADQPEYGKTSLEIELLQILIYCDDCKKNTQVEQYKFICDCGKPSRNVVQGEELLISRVEFED